MDRKNIEKRREDNLKNHFLTIFNKDRTKYIGEISKSEIKIWFSTHFVSYNYPVFYLYFDENETLIKFIVRKNPLALLYNKLLVVIVFVIILFNLYYSNVRQTIVLTIVSSIMYILFILCFKKYIRLERSLLIEKFTYEILEKNKTEIPKDIEIVENEWTAVKIFTRILVYPFCFFIMYFILTEFLLKGKFKFIPAIMAPIAYLYSDLSIILKKIKNNDLTNSNSSTIILSNLTDFIGLYKPISDHCTNRKRLKIQL